MGCQLYVVWLPIVCMVPAEHGLTITNTLFRQKDSYKTSWRHPRSGHWHLIDFIIVRQDDATDVHVTRATQFTDACWTDHRLIRSIIKIQIQPKQFLCQMRKPGKFNVGRLYQPEVNKSFQKALSEKLKDIEINTTDVSWELIRNTITDTCSTELGRQERVHEDWFDEINAVCFKAQGIHFMASGIQKPSETGTLPQHQKCCTE